MYFSNRLIFSSLLNIGQDIFPSCNYKSRLLYFDALRRQIKIFSSIDPPWLTQFSLFFPVHRPRRMHRAEKTHHHGQGSSFLPSSSPLSSIETDLFCHLFIPREDQAEEKGLTIVIEKKDRFLFYGFRVVEMQVQNGEGKKNTERKKGEREGLSSPPKGLEGRA